MQNNVYSNIFFYMGTFFYMFEQQQQQQQQINNKKIKIFKFLYTKYMEKSEVMTPSTHPFAYWYWLFKKSFVKILNIFKFHIF